MFIKKREKGEREGREGREGLNQKSYKYAHAYIFFKKEKKAKYFLAGGFDLSPLCPPCPPCPPQFFVGFISIQIYIYQANKYKYSGK